MVIITFLVLVGLSVLFWSMACFCTKKPSRVVLKEAMKPFGRTRRRRTRATRSQLPVNYTLLSNKDNEDDQQKDLLGMNDLDSGVNGDFAIAITNSSNKRRNSRKYSSTDSGDSSDDVTIFDSAVARASKSRSTRGSGSASSANAQGRPHVRA